MRSVRAAVLCLAALSASCSIALDESSGVYSSAPGKYDFLNCPDLAGRSKTASAREAELTGLIERGNQDAAGPVVAALVYRDELNAVRADLQALRKASDDKRCTPVVPSQIADPGPLH